MRFVRLFLALLLLCALAGNAQACLRLGAHVAAATCCGGADDGHGDEADGDAAGECAACAFTLPTAPAPVGAPTPPLTWLLKHAGALCELAASRMLRPVVVPERTDPPPDPVLRHRIRSSAPRALPVRGPDFRA